MIEARPVIFFQREPVVEHRHEAACQSGDKLMKSIVLRSFKKAHVIGMFVLAAGLLATPVLMPSVGNAQDARVAKSMAALKGQTTKLGAPKG